MFLVECSRNEEVWCTIPEEFLSWSAFREGSYWVYQNNRTGETDCTYVTGYTSGNYVSGQKPDPIRHIDVINMDLKSGLFRDFQVQGNCYGESAAWIIYGALGMTDVHFDSRYLTDPEYFKNYNEYNFGIVAVYPSELIGDTTYTNVYHFRQEWQNWYGDSIRVDLHFVRNAGIVFASGQVEQADTSWSLIRSQIIQ